jgi:hypothetical protein
LGLVYDALDLAFGIARGATKGLFDLPADVLEGASHMMFVHSVLLCGMLTDQRLELWFKRHGFAPRAGSATPLAKALVQAAVFAALFSGEQGI